MKPKKQYPVAMYKVKPKPRDPNYWLAVFVSMLYVLCLLGIACLLVYAVLNK